MQLPDGRRVDYEVDAEHRRIGKKINGMRQYGLLYQGELRPVAQLDGTGNVVTTLVFATHATVPAYMQRRGEIYRFFTGHIGSVRLVVKVSDGSIVQRLDYDEFGVVTNDSNPGFQPFGFAGGIYDGNLYDYCQGDPVNQVDRHGKFFVQAVVVLAVVVTAVAAYASLAVDANHKAESLEKKYSDRMEERQEVFDEFNKGLENWNETEDALRENQNDLENAAEAGNEIVKDSLKEDFGPDYNDAADKAVKNLCNEK